MSAAQRAEIARQVPIPSPGRREPLEAVKPAVMPPPPPQGLRLIAVRFRSEKARDRVMSYLAGQGRRAAELAPNEFVGTWDEALTLTRRQDVVSVLVHPPRRPRA